MGFDWNGVDRWFDKPLQPEQFLADLKRELGDTA